LTKDCTEHHGYTLNPVILSAAKDPATRPQANIILDVIPALLG
jgi:hypothetical protein